MSPVEWNRDLRLALRLLAKNPGATALAVLSIALGIGLTTGLFAVGDAALWRPLPVERPRELWSVNSRGDDGNWMMYGWADYLDMAKALEGRAQLVATQRRGVQVGEESDLVIIQPASANYFQVVGVKAALGRASLGEAGGRPETVLGYRLWQTRFASDPQIVGRTVLLNHKAFLVAGVMPDGFTGLQRGLLVGVWVGPDGWFSTLGNREEEQSRDGDLELAIARLLVLHAGQSGGRAVSRWPVRDRRAIPRSPDRGTRWRGTGRRHPRSGKAQTRARRRFGNGPRMLRAALGVRRDVRRWHGGGAGVGPVRGVCQRGSVASGAGRSAPQGTGRADRPGRGRLASGASVVGGDRSAQPGGRRIGPAAGPASDGEGFAVRAHGGALCGLRYPAGLPRTRILGRSAASRRFGCRRGARAARDAAQHLRRVEADPGRDDAAPRLAAERARHHADRGERDAVRRRCVVPDQPLQRNRDTAGPGSAQEGPGPLGDPCAPNPARRLVRPGVRAAGRAARRARGDVRAAASPERFRRRAHGAHRDPRDRTHGRAAQQRGRQLLLPDGYPRHGRAEHR